MKRKEARSVYGQMLEELVKQVNDGAKYKDIIGKVTVMDALYKHYATPIKEARTKAYIETVNAKYGTNIEIEE